MKYAGFGMILILILAGCGGNNVEIKTDDISIADVSTDALLALSKKTIYFGHQSVGFNILDGIEAVIAEDGRISTNAKETTNPEDLTGAVFAHFRAGENTKPESKITDFKEKLNNDIGTSTDIAFLKLCYVDFSASTDSSAVFENYRSTFKDLKERHPDTTFVHLTAPLTTIQSGPKAWAKRLLGRDLYGIEDNVKRQEYNELIRQAYSGKEPLFDIAEIESTRPDGTRIEMDYKGYTYYAMYPNYTSDGGHLNESGGKLVAAELIKVLADINGDRQRIPVFLIRSS